LQYKLLCLSNGNLKTNISHGQAGAAAAFLGQRRGAEVDRKMEIAVAAMI
jgi:hypothetical protein